MGEIEKMREFTEYARMKSVESSSANFITQSEIFVTCNKQKQSLTLVHKGTGQKLKLETRVIYFSVSVLLRTWSALGRIKS